MRLSGWGITIIVSSSPYPLGVVADIVVPKRRAPSSEWFFPTGDWEYPQVNPAKATHIGRVKRFLSAGRHFQYNAAEESRNLDYFMPLSPDAMLVVHFLGANTQTGTTVRVNGLLYANRVRDVQQRPAKN